MSDKYVDPSGNTEQFRAFAHAPEAGGPTAPDASRTPLVAGVAVAVVVLVAVVAWLALA
ncbi:hypothetical protein OOK41_07850 [Micromonospora sp. NBC_01655]|uniref:hypothetical protein n=1 Tax=unclassified Micromonospora TaxID=2617518 RepID=UPI0014043242|nr:MULTISPECIES: hypothetical protein [unclassified Micromonospora]MCX4470216.1 hypothetical protein [Micromonospora sp. NBC_01655]